MLSSISPTQEATLKRLEKPNPSVRELPSHARHCLIIRKKATHHTLPPHLPLFCCHNRVYFRQSIVCPEEHRDADSNVAYDNTINNGYLAKVDGR